MAASHHSSTTQDQIFPFLFESFSRSTKGWSDEAYGAYLRLLLHQWEYGTVPVSRVDLLRIAPSTASRSVWELVGPKFVACPGQPGRLINLRLEAIRAKEDNLRIRNRENGSRSGGRPKKGSV